MLRVAANVILRQVNLPKNLAAGLFLWMKPAGPQAIHAGGLFLWMEPARSPSHPRRRPVFVDATRLEPKPSTLEAGFCGWPLHLWHIPFVLCPSFSVRSRKGCIGGALNAW